MKVLLIIFFWFPPWIIEAKTSAIIDEWKTNIDVKKSGNLTITEYIKVKVLDEDGYVYSIFRSHYNSFRSVNNVRYTIFDASGNRIKKLTKSDAVDVMLNPSYEVADSRLIYLEPNYRNFPFTVEIEVETHYNGFIDFPVWMPRYSHDLEVKKATLIFTCPKEYEFRTIAYNGVKEPVTTSTTDLKQLTWSVENLPSVTSHRSYRAFAADQPKVYLAPFNFELDKKSGSFRTWQNFGDWYFELNQSEAKLSDHTKKDLNAIREASKDPRELVEQVYRYMQSKTRYVSIQLGIGGHKALPVSQVDESGYGDCKALSSYTKAMLDFLKITSNYVLVNAGRDVPDVLHDFPSNQFNHVFLAVPLKSDTLWLECTSQITPPSYLGSFTDDRNALWIDNGKSKIIRTPAFTTEQSLKKTDCHAVVDYEGNVSLVVKRRQSGIYFDEIMAYKSMSKDQIDNYNYKKFPYKDFTIQSFDYSANSDKHSIDLNFRINASALAQRAGNKFILPVNILSSIESEIEFDALNKKSSIRNGFTWEDNIVIEMPANFHVDYLPEASHVTSEFGKIEMMISTEKEKRIQVKRKVVIYKGSYNAKTFDHFHDFLKQVRSVEQGKVVIQNKT